MAIITLTWLLDHSQIPYLSTGNFALITSYQCSSILVLREHTGFIGYPLVSTHLIQVYSTTHHQVLNLVVSTGHFDLLGFAYRARPVVNIREDLQITPSTINMMAERCDKPNW